MAKITLFVCMAAVSLAAPGAGAQWAVFEEDPSRLDGPAALGAADPDEKDYAWGDVDRDGANDVIIADVDVTLAGCNDRTFIMHNLGNGTAAPAADATPDPDGTMAFVTENGPPGGLAGNFDVDGGPTYLVSPIIDLAGSESLVSYARWAFTATGVADSLSVEVSDDGVVGITDFLALLAAWGPCA